MELQPRPFRERHRICNSIPASSLRMGGKLGRCRAALIEVALINGHDELIDCPLHGYLKAS